jgi:thiamine-monophosphate kinase
MTVIGRAQVEVPNRSGGKEGDSLWLVGTVGDAAAGLGLLRSDGKATGALVDIYRRPVPQLVAGRALAPHAHAMMDVSDGLLLDARRLAEASHCSAAIELDALPLSRAFVAEHGQDLAARLFAATGGDDYALLAALPAEIDAETLSLPKDTRITRIGSLTGAGPSLCLTSSGKPVELPERLGFEHESDLPGGLSASAMADRP